MKCPRCGKSISEQSKFCQECGFQIVDDNIRYFKRVKLRCKDCGATMTIEADNQQAVCPYCGSKEIIIEDTKVTLERIKSKTAKDLSNIEFKKAQEKNKVDLEKLYYEEHKKVRETKRNWQEATKGFILLSILFGVAFLLCIIYNISNKITGKISLPSSPGDYVGEYYHTVEMELEDSGFTNVIPKPLEDLENNSEEQEGIVYKIMIDGKTDRFPSTAKPDVPIFIYYHSLELPE